MKGLNLSEWALKHQQMMAFLLLLLTITGVLAYRSLGQKEDPEFTIKTMVVQAYWPGSSAAADGGPGHRQDREEAAGGGRDRLHGDLCAARRNPDQGQPAGSDCARRGARRLVPGAQEGRRHARHLAGRRAGPVLQRRVRRHLRQPVRPHGRRIRQPRTARVRRRGAQRVPARAGREQGGSRRQAGREDLRRGLDRQAGLPGDRSGAHRHDPRPDERRRGRRHGAVQRRAGAARR